MSRALRARLPQRMQRDAPVWRRLRVPLRLPRELEWVPAAGAAGLLWIGPAGAAIGVVVACASGPIARARERRRRARRIDEALPGFVASVAAAIRAGVSPARAVAEADAAPPLDAAVRACAEALRVGEPFEDALAVFATAAGTAQARMAATAIGVGHRSGGDLPRVLDALSQIARDRARLAREVGASTAQARASAWIVALLPVAFLFLSGAASGEQTRLLLGTPAGWALLGAGAALESLGIVWMRRLASP